MLPRTVLWSIFLLFTVQVQLCQPKAEGSITIIGLIPLSGPTGHVGHGIKPAVDLALRDINRHSSLLPSIQLDIRWLDSQCDLATATQQLFDILHSGATHTFLFGGYCNSVTKALAESIGYFNITQISFADSDPTLSDQSTYTHFMRVVPSELDFNQGQISFIRHFNWTRVATLFQDASTGVSTHALTNDDVISRLHTARIDIITTESFADDPSAGLENIKSKDGRIIIGNFDHYMAVSVLCKVYQMNMFGYKYVWILPSTLPVNWWKNVTSVDCTVKEMELALNGHFQLSMPTLYRHGHNVLVNGRTVKDYEREYNKSRGKNFNKYHGYAYDGVWLMALSLQRNLLHLPNLNQSALLKTINQMDFVGVTGKIAFANRTRLGHLNIEQYVDGEFKTVALYDMNKADLSLIENVYWHGYTEPPLDTIIKERHLEAPDDIIRFTLFGMALLGMLLGFGFLAVNIKFRKTKYIKMSSPTMNNIIVVGCLLIFTSVFLLRVDSRAFSLKVHQVICIARSWVLCIGFSLSFGAMFAKTWRVYSIFNAPHKQKRVIKDHILLLIVVVLVLIDLVLLITWSAVDPLQVTEHERVPEVKQQRIVTFIFMTCQSTRMNVWIPIFYAYKGVLLVVGCYFAWQTRHVSIPALNDSKYIGMSVYNVVIMCAAAVAISYIITDKPDYSFLITGILIILCTTITLCLVFGPKVLHLRKDPNDQAARPRVTLKKKKESSCKSYAASDTVELEIKINGLAADYDTNIHKLEELTTKTELLESKSELALAAGDSPLQGSSTETAVVIDTNDIHCPDVDSAYKGLSQEESR